MTEQGIVIELDNTQAKVQLTASAECAGCAAKSHCHPSPSGGRVVTVVNQIDAVVGEKVQIETPTSRVILAAALVWIMPIVGMIVGYLLGDYVQGGSWGILWAFVFFAGSLVLLRILDRAVSGGTAFHPRITRIIGN